MVVITEGADLIGSHRLEPVTGYRQNDAAIAVCGRAQIVKERAWTQGCAERDPQAIARIYGAPPPVDPRVLDVHVVLAKLAYVAR